MLVARRTLLMTLLSRAKDLSGLASVPFSQFPGESSFVGFI